MHTSDSNSHKAVPMRTDDCARQLEYVTHAKWTADEYKAVCSVLRLYRYQAIVSILDQAAGSADDSGRRELK